MDSFLYWLLCPDEPHAPRGTLVVEDFARSEQHLIQLHTLTKKLLNPLVYPKKNGVTAESRQRSTCAMPEKQSKAASAQLASIKVKHETQVLPSEALNNLKTQQWSLKCKWSR